MKVAIVGAGAMGSLFGGMLAGGGHEVWFVDLWQAHVDEIERNGLRMTFRGEERVVLGHGTSDPSVPGEVDLVQFWCKSFSTAEALDAARPLIGEGTVVCTLQNGLGNVEQLEEHVHADRIVYGVTGIGALTMAPGHIELTEGAWTGSGLTWIGARTGVAQSEAERVAAALEASGIRMEVRVDIDNIVWNKLAMASAMATMTAITRLDIARVLDDPDAVAVMREVTREIVAVAQAKGLALDLEDALDRQFATYETARGHHPSMLQDVLGGRRTEIDALCGAVVREGAAVGIDTPVNRTICSLIRSVEANYDAQLLGGER